MVCAESIPAAVTEGISTFPLVKPAPAEPALPADAAGVLSSTSTVVHRPGKQGPRNAQACGKSIVEQGAEIV